MSNPLPLLSDVQMQSYIVDGYLTIQTDFPAEFHANICRQAEAIFEQGPNPWNDIYPMIPELAEVFAHPKVAGALTGILGPSYIMHPHRHCHLNSPGTPAQNQHKDSYEEDQNVRHHRSRWAMAFYYPQDVTVAMGPSAIQPGTQYYNTHQEAKQRAEIALTGQAGTVTIIHYDLWHRALANKSNQQRFMLKFLFCRMEEPTQPSWKSVRSEWVLQAERSSSDQHHEEMWQNLWHWHTGQQSGNCTIVLNADHGSITEQIGLLFDSSEASRLNAAYRLGSIGEAAVPALIEALYTESVASLEANLHADHTNPSELHAGHALAAVGESAVPALTDAVSAKDWCLRAAAAAILGNIGLAARSAVPALVSALQDESEWVRRNSVEALGTIGRQAKPAVPKLTHILTDECERTWVRHNAALALARIGSEAAPAISALQSVLEDDDLYISGNSQIALQRMRGASN